MTIKIITLGLLILIAGCSKEITLSDIERDHSLQTHVNGSLKLSAAERDLISTAPQAFVNYQTLRHDKRSYLVSNLRQLGEKRDYLIGDGFFLIDESYLLRSSRNELTNLLIRITQKPSEREKYVGG